MIALLCIGHGALDTIYSVAEIPTMPTKVLATACIEPGGGMAATASVTASWGGLKCTHVGGRLGAPTRAEVEDFPETHGQ